MPEAIELAPNHPARSASALELTGSSAAVGRVMELVRRAATLDGAVLITAEQGCGVDPVAREIHARGRHSDGPFVSVMCGALDAAGLDRALFGAQPSTSPADLEVVARGSHIAAALGGVLCLHDVTELPASAQARLARIARDGQVRIERVAVETRIRFVASATVSLEREVDSHRFRADLYRRLSMIRIDLPPLRDRHEDIPALATRLLEECGASRGASPQIFTHAALALIGALPWRGNLFELQQSIERVVANVQDDVIHIEHLVPALRLRNTPDLFAPKGTLRDARLQFEREYIASVLQHHDWHMASAARTLGIQRPNLYRKARQLGIPLTRATD
ncbi:MAG TPA: sigma 54-interacting transcriptional regulator [Vicinamibacterales bacterium]|jgi:DNA-binding NtrC family response regulator